MSTRPCARCGIRIPRDHYLCDDCREERTVLAPAVGAASQAEATEGPDAPAPPQQPSSQRSWRGRPIPRGMILPSRTQYHGTMFALVAAAVAVTMAAAVLVNKGIGPFTVTGLQPSRSEGIVSVTGLVRNGGEHPGRARCVATWTNLQGGDQQSGVIQTAVIEPSRSVSVTVTLANLTQIPQNLAVDCK